MAVRLSTLRTRRTLLPRNIIIWMFLVLISVRGFIYFSFNYARWIGNGSEYTRSDATWTSHISKGLSPLRSNDLAHCAPHTLRWTRLLNPSRRPMSLQSRPKELSRVSSILRLWQFSYSRLLLWQWTCYYWPSETFFTCYYRDDF
jgi:hypothetical protein